MRTDYQRDRDRILHTKAFRRLKHKTQVFIAPAQDHFVTRLTHTLEVAQVARTITRALNLNEDLAEAAALGHDIGHGPFGHAGEEALAACLPEGFRHNYQSVRVLDKLEGNGQGLNLTFEVLDAIGKSSKTRDDIFAEGWGVPETLEVHVGRLDAWFLVSVYRPEREHFVSAFVDITERKRAELEVNRQLAELRRWYEATLDREDRLRTLKVEVNGLRRRLGKPPRYRSVEPGHEADSVDA